MRLSFCQPLDMVLQDFVGGERHGAVVVALHLVERHILMTYEFQHAPEIGLLGVESEIVQIGRKPVRMCINCGGCRQNNGAGCAFDDDMCSVITEKMKDADALIVGTPVYYGQPNGGILSLMQRLFFSAGHLVQNKPAAALAVCRRGGATATLQTMNMMFEMMNMPVVTSQYWNIAYGAGKGEVKLDTEGMQTMRTLATNMAFLLQKIHADGHPAPQRDERPAFMNFIR